VRDGGRWWECVSILKNKGLDNENNIYISCLSKRKIVHPRRFLSNEHVTSREGEGKNKGNRCGEIGRVMR
jgi:hypothetical protein